MKKVLTIVIIIAVLASLAVPSFAGCTQGYTISGNLNLYSNRAAAQTSSYMHMVSAYVYARNSITGQSASNSATETYYSTTATAYVDNPNQASGSFGAWSTSSSGCPDTNCSLSLYKSI